MNLHHQEAGSHVCGIPHRPLPAVPAFSKTETL